MTSVLTAIFIILSTWFINYKLYICTFMLSAHSAHLCLVHYMLRHSMEIVRAAVQHLNPGQVPVVALDQPLYALAKQTHIAIG